MQDLLTALALVIVIEGLLYAAFPDALRRALLVMLGQPVMTVRLIGLAAATIGLIALWLVRG